MSDPVARPPLRLVFVGHVDHGKSTLIGRLLHDTGSLPEGKLDEIRAVSARRGMPLEWSFVLDAFQAERDQAVTIDVTEIRFHTARRDYVIVDAPGHREFLRNTISGAAAADAAVLMVDAAEGLREQTRRHAYLLHLLGIAQVVVAVNKMDLVGRDPDRFRAVAEQAGRHLERLGIRPVAIVPVVAREGENLATPSQSMPWYGGELLVEALDRLAPPVPATTRPLRLPVQDVYKLGDKRVLVGRIESGLLRIGDELLFSPSGRRAQVASIESWGADPPPAEAVAGQSVGITLDRPIFVERGDIASDTAHPPDLASQFRLRLFWLAEAPLRLGQLLKLRRATSELVVTVEAIESVIDNETLAAAPAEMVGRDETAVVRLRARGLLAFDPVERDPAMARCALIDGYDTVGGGVIVSDAGRHGGATSLFTVEHLLTVEARAARNGHRGAVIWLTGLSGAGKSTLAMQAERELFARGYSVYVLDGDNVRRGLNADLGFGASDRAENIRRVGEVAGLFADAGTVVITAFISPYRADRDRARRVCPGLFHEVHVAANIETCERRDPKGLYRRARAGELADFTGISAPYEAPAAPELTIDTGTQPVEASVDELVRYIVDRTRLAAG
ncbi:adenylyl-sulfate kinase [Desertibaculum subflavum]|uniref:adenylyl-sulfate kinase n=1 Tax=Desertibaculum subflavum TaxID=2268458 RepID=UPI000E66D1E3